MSVLVMGSVSAAPGAVSASTPGPGRKCYSYEEYDVRYSRGDEWVCLRIGKSWQNRYMWFLYE